MELTQTHKGFQIRESCPVCSHNISAILLDTPFDNPNISSLISQTYNNIPNELLNFNYLLEECLNCSLIYQKEIFDTKNLSKLYDEWIPEEESKLKRSVDNTALIKLGRIHELMGVAKLLKKQPEEITVLDYGMGWGDWLQTAHSLNFKSIGFEFSEERTDFSKKYDFDVVNNLSEIPNESLDFVYSNQVFEHLGEPRKVLKEIYKKVSQGGIVCIKVPDGSKIKRDSLAIENEPWKLKQLRPLEHINCFNKKSLRILGSVNGFEKITGPYYPNGGSLKEYIKSNLKFIIDIDSQHKIYLRK